MKTHSPTERLAMPVAGMLGHARLMLRVLCVSGLMMAPLFGTMAWRAQAEPSINHGVGFALLVTLQRSGAL